ncbi:MAG: DUF5722 domain-containing protein, partial [Planctomycetota bacterium]
MTYGCDEVRNKCRAHFFLVGLLLFFSSLVQAKPLAVSADTESITLELMSEFQSPIRVYAVPAYRQLDQTKKPLYQGETSTIRIERKHAGADLLYQRFYVIDAQGNKVAGPVWVHDTRKLPKLTHEMPWPNQIKGVSNPEDFDDLVALGVKHVHVNFILSTLLLPEQAPDPPTSFIRQVNGHTIRFNPQTIRAWDQKLKRMTDDGINVVAVLLNRLPDHGSKDSLLVHPDTDIAGAPHKLGAFNLDSDQAIAAYTGAVGFLAERYSRLDKRFGWIGGYIVGNEVDSHWVWHNMGPADLEKVADHYIQEVRLAWLAIREQAKSPRVFVSLTHS